MMQTNQQGAGAGAGSSGRGRGRARGRIGREPSFVAEWLVVAPSLPVLARLAYGLLARPSVSSSRGPASRTSPNLPA